MSRVFIGYAGTPYPSEVPILAKSVCDQVLAKIGGMPTWGGKDRGTLKDFIFRKGGNFRKGGTTLLR